MSFRLRFLLFYLNYIAKKPDYSKVTAVQMRRYNEKEKDKVEKIIEIEAEPMDRVEDEEVEMRDGTKIPVRVYYPSKEKNLPLVVFYHGGGFVTRSIDSHDKPCRRLAKSLQAVVVSVGYRLAPEYKFPYPGNDSYDATVWAAANAERFGANPERIIVAGDSAGGNLATVVAIMARDMGGPPIAAQVLIYPTTDARLCHPSIETYGGKYFLTKDLINWFVDNYKSSDADIVNPLMSPFLQPDLSNLPPAFVCTAEYDPLKDEGEAYAKRLEEAGNEVIFKEYSGVIHGFMNMPKVSKEGIILHEDIRAAIAKLLDKVPS